MSVVVILVIIAIHSFVPSNPLFFHPTHSHCDSSLFLLFCPGSPGCPRQNSSRLPRITGFDQHQGLDHCIVNMEKKLFNVMEEALSGDRAASCRKEQVAKHYFMGGKYMGVLYLSTTTECKFRSALTNITTQWHGNWRFCEHCQGINAYFDL